MIGFYMLNIAARNSMIGKAVKRLSEWCHSLENTMEGSLKNSRLNGRIEAAGKIIKRYSEQSFLLKTISEWNGPILDIGDSGIIGFASFLMSSAKKRLLSRYVDSKTAVFINLVRMNFRADPFKAIGVIIFTAALTKIVISIVARSHADPLGRLIEILFLLLGYSCMRGKNIKETSRLIKFFNI